jgi:hypothetical protein
VADPYAGHIGDGVEGAGLQLAELNVQVAGTWFHRFSHLQFVKRGLISPKVRNLWERACPRNGVSDDINVDCAAAFAGKPAPTWIA